MTDVKQFLQAFRTADAHNLGIELGNEEVSELRLILSGIASRESQLAEAKAKLAWVPVSERLPEDRATVLVAFKNREILTATYYEHYEGFGGVENYWHIEGWHSGNVTHWMHLPQPPEVQE